MFGNGAEMGELKIQHVLATGQRVLNYEYSAKMPNRSEVGHWIVNYFPIKSQTGKIIRVCVTVSEVTKLKTLEESLRRRSRNPVHVDSALKGDSTIFAGIGESRAGGLSPREREIIQLLANGKANKEIGAILDISVRTVETHRARIMYKLGLHSVAGLVLYAVRNNIIQP
jgi:DNA-binding CsgD family transcriptional regulator